MHMFLHAVSPDSGWPFLKHCNHVCFNGFDLIIDKKSQDGKRNDDYFMLSVTLGRKNVCTLVMVFAFLTGAAVNFIIV